MTWVDNEFFYLFWSPATSFGYKVRLKNLCH